MQGVRVQGLLFECPHGGVMPGVSRHGAQPGSPSLCFFLTLSAAALLFQIYCVFACSDLFVYSPSIPGELFRPDRVHS